MSRHRPGSAYGHSVQKLFHDTYLLSWTYDVFYPDSRLRYPRTMKRDTDEAGAERFCRKWHKCSLAEYMERREARLAAARDHLRELQEKAR